LQLQVSAQTDSQKISEQNEISAVSKMGGKTGKNNKLGAFAKMLAGLRAALPQNSAVGAEAAGAAVKQRVQQLAAQKKQPKTAQARQTAHMRETLSFADQSPVESKKKNSSQQQEARGIEVLFANKTSDSTGKTRKTASSPSGAEQGKKEISASAAGAALPKAAPAPAHIQEAALPTADGAASLKPPAGKDAAETVVKTGGRKKEASPSAGEIPLGAAEQPLLTKEAAAWRQPRKTDGEGKVARTKRKDRFEVEIHDARTIAPSAAQPQALHATAVQTDADAAEITLDLNHAQDAPETEAPDKANASRNFADMLSRALGDTLSNDIVRQAAIVLRDGGQGAIRLSLKPETLGSVKIRLELAENKITGTIFVSSEEAYRAFEKEVRALEQAFKESGFESADLNTTFASGGDGRNGRQWDDAETRRYFSGRFAAERYDAAEALETIHALGNGWEPEQRVAVDMFV
jgi:flagellar hook-length control protein FliK